MAIAEIEAHKETEAVTAHVIWMTTGLSCDGDSVAMTSATNPSLEDIITQAIPGMPKVVVQMGVNRSDEGWLGNGIYFGDAACASTFYTTPAKGGTRLMALALVALGEMKEYTKISYGLSAPPPGYHSCHGLRSRPGLRSQFEDDEYAVYQTNQQRLEYLVEFTA